MPSRTIEEAWRFLYADLKAYHPEARTALLQKLKEFFCFGCGHDNQNDYCRCGTPART